MSPVGSFQCLPVLQEVRIQTLKDVSVEPSIVVLLCWKINLGLLPVFLCPVMGLSVWCPVNKLGT